MGHSCCVLFLLSSVALSGIAWELLLGTQFLCPSVVEFCCFKCCCLGTVAWDTVPSVVEFCCFKCCCLGTVAWDTVAVSYCC